MGDEALRELFRIHREGQAKYRYFLLAAVGAALALAVNQTHGAGLRMSQAPLAAAVLCWGLSFYFGCRHLHFAETATSANIEMLRTHDPILGKRYEDVLDVHIEVAKVAARWQFRMLILGALLYIAWHVTEMYLRGAPTIVSV